MSYKDKTKTVEEGGTGKQSLTTYGVVTGGTTATGNTQSITNGDADTLLTSTGSSSLPAWIEQPTIWENLVSDPSSPSDGDVWFNSTSNTFKGATSGGTAWVIKASMNTGRSRLGGAGSATAALSIGGYAGSGFGVATVESYAPDSWTSETSCNSSHQFCASVGTTSDALVFGNVPSGGVTERYNGSTWTTKTSLNQGRERLASAGVASSALSMGGIRSGVTQGTVELYDGSGDTWTTKTSLNHSSHGLGGASDNQATALAFQGSFQGGGAFYKYTELYNGSTWTNKTNALYGLRYIGSGGTSGNALSWGGVTPRTIASEAYEGGGTDTWTATSSLNVAVEQAGGVATSNTSALSFGGRSSVASYSTATEEFGASTTIVTFTTT